MLFTACAHTKGDPRRAIPLIPQRIGGTPIRTKPAHLADSARVGSPNKSRPPLNAREPKLRRCTPAEIAELPQSVATGVYDARWSGVDSYTAAILTIVKLLQMGCGLAVPDFERPVPPAP